MCEHYIARAAEPFQLRELWPFTARLEQFGMAGFGWGAAWLGDDGQLHSHRDIRAFRDDHEGGMAVGFTETTSALVHLRRPSKLSTLQLADTQPFLDPAGRFAFSHNGDLREIRDARRRFQAEGRIHGRAVEGVVQAQEPKGHTVASTTILNSLQCLAVPGQGDVIGGVHSRDHQTVAGPHVIEQPLSLRR